MGMAAFFCCFWGGGLLHLLPHVAAGGVRGHSPPHRRQRYRRQKQIFHVVPEIRAGTKGGKDRPHHGKQPHQQDPGEKRRRRHKDQGRHRQRLIQQTVFMGRADHAQGDRQKNDHQSAHAHQLHRGPVANGQKLRHGLPVLKAFAQIAPEQAADPGNILPGPGLVQPILPHQRKAGLLAHGLALGDGGDGVQRRHAHHREDQNRYDEKHEDQLDHPFGNIAKHLIPPNRYQQ